MTIRDTNRTIINSHRNYFFMRWMNESDFLIVLCLLMR